MGYHPHEPSAKGNQLVKVATRGESILDKVYTDCSQSYDKVYTDSSHGEPVVLSEVGLSHHGVVLCQPALATDYEPPTHLHGPDMLRGRQRPSHVTDGLEKLPGKTCRAASCTLKYGKFESKLKSLIDTHLPVKTIGPAWVTDKFRHPINTRNVAFCTGSATYPYLRVQ